MRLGTTVYWLEFDKPVTGAATVFLRDGQLLSRDGRTICVIEDGKPKFVQAENYFTTLNDAEAFAAGWAVRLVTHFRYAAAVAKRSSGVVIHSLVAPKTAGI